MNITGMSAMPDREVRRSSCEGSSVAAGSDEVSRSVEGAVVAGERHLDTGLALGRYPSPVGELVLIAGPSGLAAVMWPDDERLVRVGPGVDARSLVTEHTTNPSAVTATTTGASAAPQSDPASIAASAGDAAAARALVDTAARQLDEYFAGRRYSFDLPLDPVGTEFQVAVWRSLADIGYGETATYGEQAVRVGRPTAVRAVGAANGRNPLSIVLPCHRVVGSDGRLTGFAGGLEAKAFLLDHEAHHRRR